MKGFVSGCTTHVPFAGSVLCEKKTIKAFGVLISAACEVYRLLQSVKTESEVAEAIPCQVSVVIAG